MKTFFVGILILSAVVGQCAVVLAQASEVTITELNTAEEYVLIKNTGDTPVNLKGWVLHDHDYGKARIYSYTFTFDEFWLQPGEVLQMQSGKNKSRDGEDEQIQKHPDATHYLRWSDRSVWNDRCDIAYLEDDQGALVAEKHQGTEIEQGKREQCR
ncbi:hypothetical protein GF339_06420 [candidate division KSB3 bacterium]|uniref:LTD domain-containing protein n=1 Tax=candidate division KSB3 bacterium TaxID=2044937 RepID=A0A9D5JU45_9BACT|nr:hypothetical protein [candidate division KSB3 bacterium]MBD3324200.1 hypothetical protein [candidate division KSB3 bacterium]